MKTGWGPVVSWAIVLVVFGGMVVEWLAAASLPRWWWGCLVVVATVNLGWGYWTR